MDVFLGLSIPKVGQPRYRSPRESDQSAVETAALRMLAGGGEVITAHLVNFRFDAGHINRLPRPLGCVVVCGCPETQLDPETDRKQGETSQHDYGLDKEHKRTLTKGAAAPAP